MKEEFDALRSRMVEKQLKQRGIKDERVLQAFFKVPRHLFVPPASVAQAYEDYPIPIGFDQTISQPYMAALMTQCLALKEASRVLEVGTGSGFQTAILAELSESVYTVERILELSREAEERLRTLGYQNISFKWGNGAEGWESFGPYDGILISCASGKTPTSLLSQLKDEGFLVIPLGGPVSQVLTIFQKHKHQWEIREICGCAFVPLVDKNPQNEVV